MSNKIISFLCLFLVVFIPSVGGGTPLEAKNYLIQCLDDIKNLGVEENLIKTNSVIITLMRGGYRSAIFAQGTEGRTDFFDPKYKVLFTCINKNSELIYVDTYSGNVILDNLDEEHPPEELNGLGATRYHFVYRLKMFILTESYKVPETAEGMFKQWEKQKNKYR